MNDDNNWCCVFGVFFITVFCEHKHTLFEGRVCSLTIDVVSSIDDVRFEKYPISVEQNTKPKNEGILFFDFRM
jgi:hypothetical protein